MTVPIARLDAEVLLAHVLGCTRSALHTREAGDVTAAQQARFGELVARRIAGEPVAYLTGEKEFWSLSLEVTPAVLVPRPETELLVEWALETARREAGGGRRMVDLGTGSGAIALALAKELPETTLLATDISRAALAVARKNAHRLNITNIEFAEGVWFAPPASRLPPPGLVISNPPYVAENDPHLAELRFEPTLALTSGADGLDAIREIVRDAPRHLAPGGWLLLEHGAEQGEAVRALFGEAGFERIETRRDLAGHERATGGRAKQ